MQDYIQELNKKLDKSRVKQFGPKAGAKAGLSFLEGHDVIRELNKVFNFEWSHNVQSVEMIYEYNYDGYGGKPMYGVAYKCVVSIDAGGQWHHGVGTGSAKMGEANRLDAHEVAMKEAETDAIKRAARCFGDRFGLALYDKTHEHVEEPFDIQRAKKDLFLALVNKEKLSPEAVGERVEAAITVVVGPETSFDSLNEEQAKKVIQTALNPQQ